MTRFQIVAEIDAVQVIANDYADNPFTFRETPNWLTEAIADEVVTARFGGEDYWYLDVQAPGGRQTAGPGDWIVRGVTGLVFTCPGAKFAATYEPIVGPYSGDVDRGTVVQVPTGGNA